MWSQLKIRILIQTLTVLSTVWSLIRPPFSQTVQFIDSTRHGVLVSSWTLLACLCLVRVLCVRICFAGDVSKRWLRRLTVVDVDQQRTCWRHQQPARRDVTIGRWHDVRGWYCGSRAWSVATPDFHCSVYVIRWRHCWRCLWTRLVWRHWWWWRWWEWSTYVDVVDFKNIITVHETLLHRSTSVLLSTLQLVN